MPAAAGPASAQQAGAILQQQESIAVQRQSVERQRAAAGGQASQRPYAYLVSPPGAGYRDPPDCPAVSPLFLQSVVQRAAVRHRVAPGLIDAVIRQESGGYPCAVSEKGAMGLMQLMPETATAMGAIQPFDVEQNVGAGTRLLAELMERYKGDLNRVLGAYNAGPAAVDRAGGAPPFPETVHYIRSILEQIKRPYDPKLFAAPDR